MDMEEEKTKMYEDIFDWDAVNCENFFKRKEIDRVGSRVITSGTIDLELLG